MTSELASKFSTVVSTNAVASPSPGRAIRKNTELRSRGDFNVTLHPLSYLIQRTFWTRQSRSIREWKLYFLVHSSMEDDAAMGILAQLFSWKKTGSLHQPSIVCSIQMYLVQLPSWKYWNHINPGALMLKLPLVNGPLRIDGLQWGERALKFKDPFVSPKIGFAHLVLRFQHK